MSAVVDQKFPSGGICHPISPMLRKLLVVVDPVRVDSIYLPGCRFWNCSKFLRKRPEDWHVGVRFCLVGAVVVVGSIVTPWRYYGRSVERGTDLKFVLKNNSKHKTAKRKNNNNQVPSGFSA